MTDGEPIDYEALYKQTLAERDSYSQKLGEYVDENNRLRADLKVAQDVAKRTVGTSTDAPKQEVRRSFDELVDEYRKSIKVN